MKVFEEESGLLDELKEEVTDTNFQIVTIDGWDGAGKTRLAEKISSILNLKHIELDTFLNKHQGGFINHIRYADLGQTIQAARDDSSSILVEGICVLEVLRRIGVRPDITIYVKRILSRGFWSDGRHLPDEKSADEVIEEDKEEQRQWARMRGRDISDDELNREDITYELIKYHYADRPHENADYIFERVDERF